MPYVARSMRICMSLVACGCGCMYGSAWYARRYAALLEKDVRARKLIAYEQVGVRVGVRVGVEAHYA